MALVDKIHVSTNIYIYITLYLTIQINNQNNEPYYLIKKKSTDENEFN